MTAPASLFNIVPTSRAAAEAPFDCAIYRCKLGGHACAGRWRNANADDQAPRSVGNPRAHDDGCVGCQAGKARAKLLDGTEAPRPALQVAPAPEIPASTEKPASCPRCGKPSPRLSSESAYAGTALAPYCLSCRNGAQARLRRTRHPQTVAAMLEELARPYQPPGSKRPQVAVEETTRPAEPPRTQASGATLSALEAVGRELEDLAPEPAPDMQIMQAPPAEPPPTTPEPQADEVAQLRAELARVDRLNSALWRALRLHVLDVALFEPWRAAKEPGR